MFLRGGSKDRSGRKVTPPGASYMSNDQFAQYLADLRTNRVERPTGARPLPASRTPDRRESKNVSSKFTIPPQESQTDEQPRSSSAFSHHRSQSSTSIYSVSSRMGRPLAQQPYSGRNFSRERPAELVKPSVVVPSATYIERGQRWMEKEEAVALRDALSDMDLTKEQEEELRLHRAAQEEASELVYQHQHPEAIRPDGPYKYKEHLRKNSYAHARTESVNRRDVVGMTTGLGRDYCRSVSGSSDEDPLSPRSRVSSGSSGAPQSRQVSGSSQPRTSIEGTRQSSLPFQSGYTPSIPTKQKTYPGLEKAPAYSRRRSSGKRNISGELAGTFTGQQIWEEPEIESPQTSKIGDIPAPLRMKQRNPLNRVQFAQDAPLDNKTPLDSSKRLSRTEIYRNPPTQTRNPLYTANSEPPPPRSYTPTKDGLEIRGDDIRSATSKSLKDRSPKLPTPAVVSDKPGRPIVSFDANWRPKEADVEPVEEPRRPRLEQRFGPRGFGRVAETQSLPNVPTSKDLKGEHDQPSQLSQGPPIQLNQRPNIPIINVNPVSVPTIVFPDEPTISITPPAICVSASPTVSSLPPPSISVEAPPSISISEPPVISVSGPMISVSAPSNNTPQYDPRNAPARPLPDPKTMSSRPKPSHYSTGPSPRSHWSPAPGARATALCHQCDLPIEGRVVSLRGVSQRFHPHCFACYTCGTGLEALEISPEPSDRRALRLDRIRRRAAGEVLPETLGETMGEDGDDKLRFYCHLDWHELYAPRCKHCTTPIIGEHAVALGEHWHYGHFFCAECGDPFEQGMTHVELDGYAWCVRCTAKRTERKAPKCRGCAKGVVGGYVEACGGEWHDECFLCGECGGLVGDGGFCPREYKIEGKRGKVESKTVPVCVQCMEREWKA